MAKRTQMSARLKYEHAHSMEVSLFYIKATAVSAFIFKILFLSTFYTTSNTSDFVRFLTLFVSQSSLCLLQLLFFLSAPCSTVTCELYAECVSSNDTTGVCVCPNDCPSKLSPVCGSDGNTYNSACHLRVDSCKRKANVTVRHVGKCSKFWGFYLFPSSLLYLEFLVSGERLFFSHLSKRFCMFLYY